MKKEFNIKKMSPARFIAVGFILVIILGSILLSMPFSCNEGISVTYLEALFTATSAVCVTGLSVVEVGLTYSFFGKAVIALLIQIGGLGVMSVAVAIVMAAGKRIGMKERLLLKESVNMESFKGVVSMLRAILLMTLSFEAAGAILSFCVLLKYYPPLEALGYGVFHAVSSFNNAGFDIFGKGDSLYSFSDDTFFILITSFLIIFGGMGFFVIRDIVKKKRFKKFSLHTKISLTMTAILLIIGLFLFKLTENSTWLEAFFNSVTARTAGFSLKPMSMLSNAGLMLMMVLMFIGASPGSTGGGIKTTTFFTVIKASWSFAANKYTIAFKRRLSNEITGKAFFICGVALSIILINSFILGFLNPEIEFSKILFEVVSAFGTAGLSTGITAELTEVSKLIIIMTMYIGRIGTLTAATLLASKKMPDIYYSEEKIMIG